MSDEEFGEEAVQEARALFKTLEWTFGMIERRFSAGALS
jgi:hypothetical protein